MGKVDVVTSVQQSKPWLAGEYELAPFPAKIDRTQFRDAFGRLVQVNNASGAAYGATSITVDALANDIPAGAVLDFGNWDAVTVTLNDASVSAGDTSITVLPLSGPIPSGTTLDFGGGTNAQVVKTSADAAKGDTTLTISKADGTIADASTATFAGGRKLAYVTARALKAATSVSVKALGLPLVDNDYARYSSTDTISVQAGTLVGRTYTERDAGTGFGPVDIEGDDEIFIVAHDVKNAMVNDDVELLEHGTRIKENYLPQYSDWSTAISPPSGTITGSGATSGGALATGYNYYFAATYVTKTGIETTIGGTSAAITIASGSTGLITLNVLGISGNNLPDGVVGINLYMAQGTISAANPLKRIATMITAENNIQVGALPDANAPQPPSVNIAYRYLSRLRQLYRCIKGA